MPQTFYTSAAKGTGLRGIELDRCYTGPYDEQGRRHGVGVYKYPNHMVYEGSYQHGIKHGPGKLKFPDGGWYEGEFEADEINGAGMRRFPAGNVYTGGFRMGEMHGTGTMKYANGDHLEGSFVKNAVQGKGVKQFSNGDLYEGNFSANKINGQGLMKYKRGDSYEGQWQDGKRSGRGKCTYGCGDVYEGDWQADAPHGEGKLTVLTGGLVYEGVFVAGRPTQVPVKVNLQFSPAPGTAPPKKPAKGAAVDETPLLPVVLGAPLPSPITLTAQHEVLLTEQEQAAIVAAAAPPVKGAPKAVALPPGPVITEPPTAGNKWETCEMESQRVVTLTLHAAPPQPLLPGRLIGLCIANVQDKESGALKLRVLLLPAQLEPPLTMSRTADGEVVHGFEAKLSRGAVVFESMVIGASDAESADNEALLAALPDGTGCLVATSMAVRPGFLKLQLTDFKGRK